MKTYTKVLALGLILVASMFFAQSTHAMTPTLSVSPLDSNNVSVNVNGDPNSNIYLYYNSNYGMQSSIIGNTNNFGYFSTTLNTNSYNINQNSYVYVMVNNQQSSSVLWPTSYNYYPTTTNSGVNVSSLTLPVGGSATLSLGNNTSGLYVSSNSNPSIVSTGTSATNTIIGCTIGAQYSTITGQPCYYNYNMPILSSNTITVNAIYTGSSTLTICQNQNNVCGTITINVINNVINTGGSVLGVSTTGNACYITRTLRLGMSGPDVACLQSYLINKGYMISGMNYSSYFDINTQNAVMMFQQNNYLVPDGIVGRLTRAHLY